MVEEGQADQAAGALVVVDGEKMAVAALEDQVAADD